MGFAVSTVLGAVWGTDDGYVAEAAEGTPLDLLGPWPIYVILLAVILAVGALITGS